MEEEQEEEQEGRRILKIGKDVFDQDHWRGIAKALLTENTPEVDKEIADFSRRFGTYYNKARESASRGKAGGDELKFLLGFENTALSALRNPKVSGEDLGSRFLDPGRDHTRAILDQALKKGFQEETGHPGSFQAARYHPEAQAYLFEQFLKHSTTYADYYDRKKEEGALPEEYSLLGAFVFHRRMIINASFQAGIGNSSPGKTLSPANISYFKRLARTVQEDPTVAMERKYPVFSLLIDKKSCGRFSDPVKKNLFYTSLEPFSFEGPYWQKRGGSPSLDPRAVLAAQEAARKSPICNNVTRHSHKIEMDLSREEFLLSLTNPGAYIYAEYLFRVAIGEEEIDPYRFASEDPGRAVRFIFAVSRAIAGEDRFPRGFAKTSAASRLKVLRKDAAYYTPLRFSDFITHNKKNFLHAIASDEPLRVLFAECMGKSEREIRAMISAEI